VEGGNGGIAGFLRFGFKWSSSLLSSEKKL
jgi:hypothetical protein